MNLQKMTWTAALYGTGEKIVDEQHQQLFLLINKVLEALETNQPKHILTGHINNMGEYTKMHFSCEEDLMEKKKCATCDINKKAHHLFLKEFSTLVDEFKTTSSIPAFADKFYKFVSNWLRSHIMTIDTRINKPA